MRYPLIQIGTYYLTSDGTATGYPCRVELTGEDAFADPDTALTVTPSADGTPNFQVAMIASKGIQFEVKIAHITQTLKDNLDALIKATRGTTATVRVRGTSVRRNFDVLCKAAPEWTSAGKFSDAIIDEVVYRFITIGIGV